MNKTGVLLINLGTPNSPSVKDVRKYLFQFLNDKRVIDIPTLLRFLLVNLIIVPFRAPKSAKLYKKLWTKEGSPLMIHGVSVAEKLQGSLGENYGVHLAMRYQNPALPIVLEEMRLLNYNRLVIVPLYPHYASSSTGSSLEEALKVISNWYVIPEIKIISQYFNHSGFIQSFVERGKQYDLSTFDHVLFSFHGLPERQVDKVYPDRDCANHHCEKELTDENKYCYKATCYETARLIARGLGIPENKFSVSFQSRLDKKWLKPFSDEVVEEKAKEGCRNMLVFSPAFVADCLETTVEIGDEYKEIFETHGGKHLQLVESLNDHPQWIKTLNDLVIN